MATVSAHAFPSPIKSPAKSSPACLLIASPKIRRVAIQRARRNFPSAFRIVTGESLYDPAADRARPCFEKSQTLGDGACLVATHLPFCLWRWMLSREEQFFLKPKNRAEVWKRCEKRGRWVEKLGLAVAPQMVACGSPPGLPFDFFFSRLIAVADERITCLDWCGADTKHPFPWAACLRVAARR